MQMDEKLKEEILAYIKNVEIKHTLEKLIFKNAGIKNTLQQLTLKHANNKKHIKK
jgi:hypothetical protein